MALNKLSPELLAYIEEIGLYHEYQGISRIAGRILGLLMVTEDALSAEQIASTLQVSLGSVSTNIRLLLRSGHVEKKSVTGDRVTYYIYSENALEREFLASIERVHSLKKAIEKGAQIQSVQDNEKVSLRFADIQKGTGYYLDTLNELLNRWRSQH
ncbi:GbsR/MarR family transcriptional regulator [Brevibacillus sp. NRS-1366]|uniref:GbsR/MarR family transcriptional regulator n=1 Tax=Brevibacillus sp. NRS-1366 TaxID=3233899 RepID=UPI003D1CB077